ncbi:MAG TPA: AAA family ATPase, partial [Actinomycetota bacterium]|nr:AAA family ATPase [Actinomycetota bacterium]
MAGGHLLVGREVEKARLLDLLETAGKEKPGLVLVAGEAGIGKSALVEEVLAGIDRPILRGASTPGATSPYGPLVQILRAYARDHRDALLRLQLADHLSLLLPELGLGEVDTDPATLHAAVCDAAALAGDAGSIWVLEDLHWGDQGTLD